MTITVPGPSTSGVVSDPITWPVTQVSLGAGEVPYNLTIGRDAVVDSEAHVLHLDALTHHLLYVIVAEPASTVRTILSVHLNDPDTEH